MERHILIFRMKNSCSSEHGKLCFEAPEINSGTQNKLAARLKAREGFPPKSEIHDGRSVTEKPNAYGRKQKKKKNRKYGQKAEN